MRMNSPIVLMCSWIVSFPVCRMLLYLKLRFVYLMKNRLNDLEIRPRSGLVLWERSCDLPLYTSILTPLCLHFWYKPYWSCWNLYQRSASQCMSMKLDFCAGELTRSLRFGPLNWNDCATCFGQSGQAAGVLNGLTTCALKPEHQVTIQISLMSCFCPWRSVVRFRPIQQSRKA